MGPYYTFLFRICLSRRLLLQGQVAVVILMYSLCNTKVTFECHNINAESMKQKIILFKWFV
jgi:hypothetical protein